MNLQNLQARVRAAAAQRLPLCIRGGGSKDFYGGTSSGDALDVSSWSGIVDYEPTELVITARAGTLLRDIEAALGAHGQQLAFEPPRFDGRATLGGAVASGLSGPSRAYCGAVRDFLLGVRLIDGRGDDLRFGGKVIKNVAGFDVSRLMAGSLGTLGILTEVTLKTLPIAAARCTLRFALNQAQAITLMNRWAGKPLPVTATVWHDGNLLVRLTGSPSAVNMARDELNGEIVANADEYWNEVREQQLGFFTNASELWRISLPSNSAVLTGDAPTLIEWGGALRWLRGPLDSAALRAQLVPLKGHASLYRAAQRAVAPFSALSEPVLALHRRLKAAFDPAGIFNRGRLHPDF